MKLRVKEMSTNKEAHSRAGPKPGLMAQLRALGAGPMTWVPRKGLTTKSDNLSSIPGPEGYERTHSCKLSFCIYICTRVHVPCSNI